MPNIMLTYRCNLNCRYCFANEFVNKENNDITMDDFDKAVEFITREGSSHIGLIGGEPTLHPHFKEILERLIFNVKVSSVTIYTNGVLLDKYLSQIVHPKFRLLVNCNSPEDIGDKNFCRIVENLDTLFFSYYMKDRINLGLNLYSEDMDYGFMIDLLKRYDLHRVRISTTVPDFSKDMNVNALEYFEKRKQFLLQFFKNLDVHKILPYYDCNRPPFCIWNEEEREWIIGFVKKYKVTESNLIGNNSKCYPVIDILPNLDVVRCFGMSDFCKVHMSDFDCLTDLASYFLNEVDADAFKISAHEKCRNCKERVTRKCMTGCLGFKSEQLKKSNSFCANL